MSCPDGRSSSSSLAVKSVSGKASTKIPFRRSLKLSVVATSTSMREGRSARAQTMPDDSDTSPDCTPWVICGRSAAKLSAGRARPPSSAIAADAVCSNPRRVSAVRLCLTTAIRPPPMNAADRGY
jgi:hypothetical protein